MAGELYSLSWSLVTWVASESTIRTMTRGAEDKQTAKWMRLHPRADAIRWASERCWIYDHPRAGSVYSHGFLFPSEVRRVRKSILSWLKPVTNTFSSVDGGNNTITYTLPSPLLPTTPSYSYSSVSQFGTHYTFPLTTLSLQESVEALVEGSEMSGLFEGGPETAARAWARREGRRTRYEGNRVGGTVVVHFIKRNEWFMETALALLGGDEIVEGKQELGTETDAPGVVSGVAPNSTSLLMEARR
ncbi:hypothetical protein BU17DRAFT_74376 [Hysterangium stoloniferum]|nr:hypothetical protein BU17DRAFT_74376 [Hysterangium stoloniferum]